MPARRPERLFFNSTELAEEFERRGVPAKQASVMVQALEMREDFKRLRLPIAGDRYYFPAVQAWLDHLYGLNLAPPSAPDGTENFDATRDRRRARAGMGTA